MSFVNRYLINSNGAITFTGNTLGLSRSDTVAVPGTIDAIGAYITTDTTSQYGTYPPGTTSNFMLNSSTAILVLPAGSSVLYAELVWGGTYSDNGEDNTAYINDNVGLLTPAGSFSITPDPATAFEVVLSVESGFPPTLAYVRSADVTGLVQAAGAGSYTTSGVVGTTVIPDSNSNHAGWTLAVVYSNASLPLANLSIRVGADVILTSSGPVDTPITGFAAPITGTTNGRLQISSQEGDAVNTGDQALFGPTTSSLTALSGPNNFSTNFFASQINKDDGTLDTSGTFGDRNQINGTPGTDIIGGRQGYDITNVSLAGTIQNAQTAAVLRLTTNNDGYLVNCVGLQIGIQQPLLSIVKSTTAVDAVIGDTVTYTVVVTNTGPVGATSVNVFDTDSPEAMFVGGSATVNGRPVSGDPITGILVGSLAAGASATVTFQYTVTALPFSDHITDQAIVAYSYQPSPDSPVISTSVPSNIVKIPIYTPIITVVKSGEPSPAILGNPVTYTIQVSNTGNIAANVTATDNIPAGSTFVAGSVTLNGTSVPSANPVIGVPVVALAAETSATITFEVLVTQLPPGGVLIDQAEAAYTFQPPDGRIISGSSVSNEVDIPVLDPAVDPVVVVAKSANPASGIVGDVITYNVVVNNNSIAGILNTSVTDTIPAGSSFVAGSVTVNGVSIRRQVL